MIPILILIGWAICGILGYGMSFAYWQRKWPGLSENNSYHDMGFSIVLGIFGPFTLLITFFLSEGGKYGLKFRPRKEMKPETKQKINNALNEICSFMISFRN